MPTTERTKYSAHAATNAMIQESQDIEPITSPSSQVIMSDDPMDSQNRQYLTSLPPELLVRVLSNVPLSSYLDVAHTTKGLRSFIKASAARICNMAIRSRFSAEAKILEVTTETRDEAVENREAWLLPAKGKLEKQEQFYLSNSRYLLRAYWTNCYNGCNILRADRSCSCGQQRRHAKGIGLYSLLGTHLKGNSSIENNLIFFGVPGPHFLHLLEKIPLKGKPSKSPETSLEAEISKLPFTLGNFSSFMNAFNFREMKVENFSVANLEERFPRELVWYFGVDNLIYEA